MNKKYSSKYDIEAFCPDKLVIFFYFMYFIQRVKIFFIHANKMENLHYTFIFWQCDAILTIKFTWPNYQNKEIKMVKKENRESTINIISGHSTINDRLNAMGIYLKF